MQRTRKAARGEFPGHLGECHMGSLGRARELCSRVWAEAALLDASQSVRGDCGSGCKGDDDERPGLELGLGREEHGRRSGDLEGDLDGVGRAEGRLEVDGLQGQRGSGRSVSGMETDGRVTIRSPGAVRTAAVAQERAECKSSGERTTS